MQSNWPTGLVCVKCGGVFGTLLKPNSDDLVKAGVRKIEAICSACIGKLSKEKSITPRTPDDWRRLLA